MAVVRSLDWRLAGAVRSRALLTLLTMAWVSGCGRGLTPDEQAQVNMLRLAQLHRQYVAFHSGKEPQSADELRQWIGRTDPATLGLTGLSRSEIEALFISLRDGQPYMIVPAGKGGVTQHGDRIIVFEQKGANGKRMVAFDIGRVTEIDEMLFVHLQEEHL
jgi:hypothetical protein